MKMQWLSLLLALCLVFGFAAMTSINAKAAESEISLLYDDRKDLSELLGVTPVSVEISDQSVTSKAVGTDEADANVLIYENGTLYAVGTGTATLTVNGTAYSVKVSPAPVSMFLIIGHSVGYGQAGSAAQSVAVEPGQAYSSWFRDSISSADGGLGYGSATRAGGEGEKALDAFAAGQNGVRGVGSALAYRWNQLTGEKPWVINLAIPGSCVNEWRPGVHGWHDTSKGYSYKYESVLETFGHAQQIMKNEIAAGHYTLSHMSMVFFTGANFGNAGYTDWTYDSLKDDYETIWNGLKKDLALDMDGDGQTETLESMSFVPLWTKANTDYRQDKAVNYIMAASSDYSDVFIASDIYRDWMTEEGLAAFPEIDYTTQSAAVYKPESVWHTNKGGTSDNSVFCSADTTHLSQVTYNAVGMDIAESIKAWYEKPAVSSVQLQYLDRSQVGDTITINHGMSSDLFVPAIDPAYGANLTYELSDNLQLNWPFKIRGLAVGTGTMTVYADGVEVEKLTVEVLDQHIHCVCGGHAEGMMDHTCTDIEYKAWGTTDAEKKSLPATAGNYYLVSDITISSAPTVSTNINLCLNGYNINASARINVKANISITDCNDKNNWGTFKSTKSDKNLGGLFFIYEGSRKLNLYAGIFDASETTVYRGGIAHIGNAAGSKATVNVYGGTYKGANLVNKTDSTTPSRGGLFLVTTASTLNIYGGELNGGSCKENGGGIYVNSGTTFNMYGGTITGGSAVKGGNVFVDGTMTMQGGTIQNGVASGNGGNIATATGTVNIKGGTVTSGTSTGGHGGNIDLTGSTLNMSGGTVTAGQAKSTTGKQGGNINLDGSSVCNVSGGTVSDGIAGGYGGNICGTPGAEINVSGKAKITGGATGTSGSGTTGSGGNIFGGANSTNNSIISISGGTISGGKAQKGGNVYVDGECTISAGTISGGTAPMTTSGYGGNICTGARATGGILNISGGTISGGTAFYGGSIASRGDTTISGGTITGGVAGSLGGNIYQINDKDRTLTIIGGTVTAGKTDVQKPINTDNDATDDDHDHFGGNIYVHGANDSEVGNLVIKGGTVSQGLANCGGNIYCSGLVTIEDGLITAGQVKGSNSCGGNLYLAMARNTDTGEIYPMATMTGGTISDGKAASTGGNIQTHSTFMMTGGLISGGSAISGGSIRVFRPGSFILDGGIIDGGTASSNGGVFQVIGHTATTAFKQTATLTVKSGTIIGGTAVNGGVVSVQHFGVLNVEGGSIEGGNASGNGGSIYVYSQHADRAVEVNISGGVISGGAAASLGDGIYIECVSGAAVPNLTISADAQINGSGTNLYVDNTNDVNLTVSALSGVDRLITVDAADKTKVFATADQDYAAYLPCTDDGYKLDWSDGSLIFAQATGGKVAAVYEGTNELAQYATFADAAFAAMDSGSYVKLLADVQSDYAVTGTLWIDLNGYDLTGITVSGTLYGMDSTTDQYDDANVGKLTATVTGEGVIASNCKTSAERLGSVKRYLAIPDGEGYTFHRFYLGVTKLSLKPDSYGIGYKATFLGDASVKQYLDETQAYGYHIWLDGGNTLTRAYGSEQFGVKDTLTLRINHFLDPGKDLAFNEERANMPVNANVFVKLSTGEVIETDTISYSFKDMTELAAANYENYNESQQAALDTLGAQFEELMFQWAIPVIHHAGEDWTAWTSTTTAPATSGKYYLTSDVSISSTHRIYADQDVTLCLNGYTLSGSARIYYIYGTLSICDCCHKLAEEDRGSMIGNGTGLAPVLYTYYGSTVNLYSGNLTATNTVAQGGVLAIGNDKVDGTENGTHDSVFNMYGGKIYGGKVTGNGGNIVSWHGGTFNMYGGEIFGGQAGGAGGNMNLASAASDANPLVLNLYGGVIRDGVAAGNGGNIYGAAKSEIHIYDGAVVMDGTSLSNGGNIYKLTDGLTMEGGLISGGKAVNGGNIVVSGTDSTNLVLNGGTVTGGKAESCGGNLYLVNAGTYTLNNMTVSDGYAGNDGGNIYLFTDMEEANYTEEEFDVFLNNCTVTGGTADDKGDSIYAMEVDLTISGSTVIHNANGQSLFLDAGEKVSLKDLTANAKIYVSMNIPGTLSDDTKYLSNVYADDETMDVQAVNGGIKLVDNATSATVPELTGFSVGWHRGVITPTEPMPLDGMGNNVGRMDKWEIKTELEAGVTVIADGTGIENAIVLVSVDTLFIQKELSDNLCQAISDATGIAKNRIFFSASHTHSGVDHDAIYEATREYLEWFYPAMTSYVVKAVEDLAPASIETASIDVVSTDGNSLNISRRFIGDDGNAYSSVDSSKSYAAPDGAERESASDPEMQLIRFVRDGKTDVVMTNWQAHPTGWASGTYGRVSAENWKYFRESVESQLEDTVCTFFLGAAGNLGNNTTDIRAAFQSVDGNTYAAYVSGSTADTLQGMGDLMASYAVYALNNSAAVVETGALKVTNYTFETEDYYFTGDDTYKADMSQYKAIDMDLNAITIGDSIAFVTAPYEMFHENGQQIKAYARSLGIDTCFVLTNSMGENKYIGSNNAFANDSTDGAYSSFGVRTCRFVQGTAEALVDQYADMLAQLKGKEASDSIYQNYTVKVVDTDGNAVQNVMVELVGGGNTRNCSDADGTVVYYVYDGIDYAINVVKVPTGYTYSGTEPITFGEDRTVTVTVEAAE